jgi:cytoskeletal protein CcmA (bactofilin family)
MVTALLAATCLLFGTGLMQARGSAASSTAPAGEPAPQAEAPDTPEKGADNPAAEGQGRGGIDRNAMVLIGQNAELKAGDSAEVVVVIGGSAKIHGRVREAVVAIGGDVTVDGDVGDAVVAVLGNVHVGSGARLHRDVVASMGSVKVDSDATVEGDAVAVGGSLNIAPGATVRGQTQEVSFPHLNWLRTWLLQCVFKLRPLAPQVGWIWAVAGVFFLFYLFIAALFPRPVQIFVDELNSRPATTFFLGLLAKVLVPLVILILAVTGIGLLVVPFVGVALFVGSAVGKVALLEWLGMRVGHRLHNPALEKPLAGFLLGTLILTLDRKSVV